MTVQPTRDQLRANAAEGGAWGAVTLDLLDQLEQAEHRIARLGAQSDIRGRAVVIYRERAREAEARIKAVEDVLDHWRLDDLDLLVPAADIRRALDD